MGAKQEQEIGLQRQIAILKRRDLLRDLILVGGKTDHVERYLDALAQLTIETLASGGGDSAPIGGSAKDSSRSPSPHIGWAADLIDQELNELKRRAERLELWLEHPRPVKRRRVRTCFNCGRGLQKGAKFCPQCGEASQ